MPAISRGTTGSWSGDEDRPTVHSRIAGIDRRRLAPMRPHEPRVRTIDRWRREALAGQPSRLFRSRGVPAALLAECTRCRRAHAALSTAGHQSSRGHLVPGLSCRDVPSVALYTGRTHQRHAGPPACAMAGVRFRSVTIPPPASTGVANVELGLLENPPRHDQWRFVAALPAVSIDRRRSTQGASWARLIGGARRFDTSDRDRPGLLATARVGSRPARPGAPRLPPAGPHAATMAVPWRRRDRTDS